MSDAKTEKLKFAGVDILRSVACVCIFLYHCNTILPGEWKFITYFGEDIGNGLFFAISGFGLHSSIVNTKASGFGGWYKRRLLRILPVVVIAYVFSYLSGYYRVGSLSQALVFFVYPSLYWFVSAILISYIPLFFVGKIPYERLQLLIAVLCLFKPITMIEDVVLSRFVSGLGYMLWGYFIAGEMARPHKKISRRFCICLAGLSVLWLAAYIICKSVGSLLGCRTCSAFFCVIVLFAVCASEALGKEGAASEAASLSDEAATETISASAVAVTDSSVADSGLKNKKSRAFAAVAAVGKMALPLYLVQCFNGGMIGFYILQHVKFPLSFAVNFVVVWTLTAAVYALDRAIAGRLGRKHPDRTRGV